MVGILRIIAATLFLFLNWMIIIAYAADGNSPMMRQGAQGSLSPTPPTSWPEYDLDLSSAAQFIRDIVRIRQATTVRIGYWPEELRGLQVRPTSDPTYYDRAFWINVFNIGPERRRISFLINPNDYYLDGFRTNIRDANNNYVFFRVGRSQAARRNIEPLLNNYVSYTLLGTGAYGEQGISPATVEFSGSLLEESAFAMTNGYYNLNRPNLNQLQRTGLVQFAVIIAESLRLPPVMNAVAPYVANTTAGMLPDGYETYIQDWHDFGTGIARITVSEYPNTGPDAGSAPRRFYNSFSGYLLSLVDFIPFIAAVPFYLTDPNGPPGTLNMCTKINRPRGLEEPPDIYASMSCFNERGADLGDSQCYYFTGHACYSKSSQTDRVFFNSSDSLYKEEL